MLNQFSRTQLLLGKESIQVLNKAHIAVFGIGGVGGYVVEALVRSGIQNIDIVDNDTVCISNINRQIIATHSSLGKYKVDVMKMLVSAYKQKNFSLVWPGNYADGKLIYSEEGYPDYRVYEIKDYDIMYVI